MLEQLQEQGQSPPALLARPVLEEHLRFTWDVFWELNADRPPSMGGVTRIPFGAYLKYADLHQFTRQDTKDIWDSVRQLDAAYTTYHEERQAEKAAKGKAKGSKPGQKA